MAHEKIVAVDVGIDVKTSEKVIQFARANTFTWPVIGVHPYYASEGLKLFSDFTGLLEKNLDIVKAIGEIGLDVKSAELLPVQEKMLGEFLQLGSGHNLPVVIHSRGYFDELMRALGRFPQLKVVFHCFSYAQTELTIVLERGYMVSFALNIFKNNSLDGCIKAVPGERLLLETDCPYLYFNRQESTPLHIKNMVERVASLRGVPTEALCRQLKENACSFFNLNQKELL